MPIYEYRCIEFNSHFELLRPLNQSGKAARCPQCGGEGERLLSVFASSQLGKLHVPETDAFRGQEARQVAHEGVTRAEKPGVNNQESTPTLSPEDEELRQDVDGLRKRRDSLRDEIDKWLIREQDLAGRVHELEEQARAADEVVATWQRATREMASLGLAHDAISAFVQRLVAVSQRLHTKPEEFSQQLLNALERLEEGDTIEDLVATKKRELVRFEEEMQKWRAEASRLEEASSRLEQVQQRLERLVLEDYVLASAGIKKAMEEASALMRAEAKNVASEFDGISQQIKELVDKVAQLNANLPPRTWWNRLIAVLEKPEKKDWVSPHTHASLESLPIIVDKKRLTPQPTLAQFTKRLIIIRESFYSRRRWRSLIILVVALLLLIGLGMAWYFNRDFKMQAFARQTVLRMASASSYRAVGVDTIADAAAITDIREEFSYMAPDSVSTRYLTTARQPGSDMPLCGESANKEIVVLKTSRYQRCNDPNVQDKAWRVDSFDPAVFDTPLFQPWARFSWVKKIEEAEGVQGERSVRGASA